MESHKEKYYYLFGLLFFSVVLPVIITFSYVQAGAPEIKEECRDPGDKPIRTEYDSNLPVFAEARMLPRSEWQQAERVGMSPYFIVVNPERYYLGRYTQKWLYNRQCVRIHMKRERLNQDRRQFNMQEEQVVDCMAIVAMQSDPDTNLSYRTIDSIERDIERLIRAKRWGDVLSGPQRRISLKRCMSSKAE